MDSAASGAARRLLGPVVLLIAAHSYAVGAALLLAPEFGAALGGWDEVRPTFFMRQAGVFHFLVATVYVVEWLRCGSVRFLLLAKSTAVVFLGCVWILGDEPWVVPVSGVADGLMGLVVWWLARRAGFGVRGCRSRP